MHVCSNIKTKEFKKMRLISLASERGSRMCKVENGTSNSSCGVKTYMMLGMLSHYSERFHRTP